MDEVDKVDKVDAAKLKKSRQWRWVISGFLGVILILILIGIAAAKWIDSHWSKRLYGDSKKVVIEIPHGTPFMEICRKLESKGAVSNARLFLAFAVIHERRWSGVKIEAGEYPVALPASPRDLLDRLRQGSLGKKLTIPEGWTAAQIERLLLKEGWIARKGEWKSHVAEPLGPELFGAALPDGSEGFCFPDTYYLEPGTDAQKIRDRMFKQFAQIWKSLEPDRRDPRSVKLNLSEIVTLASIIEREARRPEELPKMASVFLNRLKIKMKLQSCATVHYALGEVWNRELTYADLKIDSPYNTYKIAGLPKGPIGNPGRAALEAVLRPAQTDDLFFVYRGDGTHEFTKTYEEHKKASKKFLKSDPHAGLVEPTTPK